MKNKIKKIIFNIAGYKANNKTNIDLVQKGILDSFSLLMLITELEKTFKIKINLKKLNTEKLRTIDKLENLVKTMKKS